MISETLNPIIISRQLRSFLNTCNGYHSSRGKDLDKDDLVKMNQVITNEKVQDQKYIYRCIKIIKNLLKKTRTQKVDFKVPMIREGILDTISHIWEISGINGEGLDFDGLESQEKEEKKSSLPSFDYITSQISYPQQSRVYQPNQQQMNQIPQVPQGVNLAVSHLS